MNKALGSILTLAATLCASCFSSGSRPSMSPHASWSEYKQAHFASEPWIQNVEQGYFRSPDWIFPAALGATAIFAHNYDHEWQDRFDRQWGDRPRIGDVTLGVLLVGTVSTGILFPGEGRDAVDQTWNQAEAFALSYGTTALLKTLVQRDRPEGSSHASFPSGHATAAFTAATLIERNLGLEAGIPAYALATATAFSRVEAGRHFPSDVLAGAAIGVLSAHLIDALHFGRPNSLQLSPSTSGQGVALSYVIDF